MASVSIATVIAVVSGVSAVSPAMPAAVGISSSPITATIDPIAAGGKRMSIHFVPIE